MGNAACNHIPRNHGAENPGRENSRASLHGALKYIHAQQGFPHTQ